MSHHECSEAILEAFEAAREANMPDSIMKRLGLIQSATRRLRGGRGRATNRRSVKFSPDTHPGVEADLALSITRHRIKDGKYVEYTIVIHQKGYQIFPIHKRYKQFEALQKDMKKENKDYELPHLPKKRWFKTNKWDDDYHIDRRFALQLYLRLMVKLYSKCSPVLKMFLELKEELPDDPDTDQPVRESEKVMLKKMESMNAQILQSLPSLAAKVDADAAAVLEGVALPPPASSYHAGAGVDELAYPPREPTPEPNTDPGITGDPWADKSPPSSPGRGGAPITTTDVDTNADGRALRENSHDTFSGNDSDSTVSDGARGRGSLKTAAEGRGGKAEEEAQIETQKSSGDDRYSENGEYRGKAVTATGEEEDYMQDSIATSRKRIEDSRAGTGAAEDDENRVAAQLNFTLLQHAKAGESLADRERYSERARSVEFLTDLGEDQVEQSASLRVAKALALRGSMDTGSANAYYVGRDEESDEDEWVDDFDV